ncbi:bifunctional metallophosphatase/5'-nucleotidase [Paenibacillus sp. GSMTC-2017]|uniref:bifunctional metallophosphatase/5'-nucleotidase n=1 Tax=Paenibacillus sp. GSMTC-2017 TaxID=2794350 RepID=UPI0018D9AA85|nr:bifunctional UDP-sugar hydrolase/5'-nucleotidase [Paenibacillus sp. GSMTC-2017]MBH5318529.1 bifunctional metallophosphatase/5'-nucleotidase [Paenibacillus sp. GSMTC-2017]
MDRSEAQVVLLHSNDIHSRLENAARIATIITEERAKCGAERVLTVDIGDHMDRMRQETEGSDGKVNMALLLEAGYEVVTLGNNEGLTYTGEALSKLYNHPLQPAVVCANMKLSATSERPEWMHPYTIVVKNGLRIGLIGVTANFYEFYLLLGWTTSEPLEEIRMLVKEIREQVDVLVVMSHLGLPSDQKMAEQIEGIDLILGAHTHHLLEEPLIINDTTVCAAGKFGDYIGRVEISLDSCSRRPRFQASCIPTGAFQEKQEASDIINNYRELSRHRLSRVITTLTEPLLVNPERESSFSNLLAAGLRRWTNADIALVNNGQLLGNLSVGPVTAGELHALCPSPINPCRMIIAGVNIRLALEQSLLEEFFHKPIKGYGFRGLVLGKLAVDGMIIQYDSTRPAMNKLISVEVNGEPLLDDKLYTVGSIDMFSFKVGYESLAKADNFQFYLPQFIRDVIEHELTNPESLQTCHKQRWLHI